MPFSIDTDNFESTFFLPWRQSSHCIRLAVWHISVVKQVADLTGFLVNGFGNSLMLFNQTYLHFQLLGEAVGSFSHLLTSLLV